MLKKCIDSAIEQADDIRNLCFSIMLNEKDKAYDDFTFPEDTCVLKEDTKEPNLSLFWNRLYAETKYDRQDILVSMVGDDMTFETKGWDRKIIDKANEIQGIGIIHCEDGYISHGSIPVNLFTSRLFVDTANKTFMCPAFKADFMDTAWGEIAKATDTNYFMPDILIKHNHMSAVPGHDETYNRLQCVKTYSDKEFWGYINESVKNLKESGIL
jgi:hypothetical protein